MSDDDITVDTPDSDKGEVLSVWTTLNAMTAMSQLIKPKETLDE
jgi:hypothetical protein